MSNTLWFQVLKYEDLLYLFYDKLSIIGYWTFGENKQVENIVTV